MNLSRTSYIFILRKIGTNRWAGYPLDWRGPKHDIAFKKNVTYLMDSWQDTTVSIIDITSFICHRKHVKNSTQLVDVLSSRKIRHKQVLLTKMGVGIKIIISTCHFRGRRFGIRRRRRRLLQSWLLALIYMIWGCWIDFHTVRGFLRQQQASFILNIG